MNKPSHSILLTLASAGLLLLGTASARAQMFANGNFETNTLPSGGAAGASSNSTIPGWTTTVGNGGNANVYVGKSGGSQNWIPTPQSGTYCVQLDGSQTANNAAFAGDGTTATPKTTSISQTFTMSPGTYLLSFYINNEVGAGKGGTSGVLVSLSGGGITTGALTKQEYTVTNPAGVAAANSVWKQITDTFTVTSGSTPITLTFQDDPNTSLSNYTASSNIAVDNVTVPEPATLLGGAGVAGLLALRGFRRRRV